MCNPLVDRSPLHTDKLARLTCAHNLELVLEFAHHRVRVCRAARIQKYQKASVCEWKIWTVMSEIAKAASLLEHCFDFFHRAIDACVCCIVSAL